jgi:hypothetical protein
VLLFERLLHTHPATLIGVTTFEVTHGATRSFVVTTNAESTTDLFGVDALRIRDLAEVIKAEFNGLTVLSAL